MAKTSTEVHLEVLCREMKELKMEVKSLKKDMNFAKGAIWGLIFIGSMFAGVYNYFVK